MKGVILAGGVGSRLTPLTHTTQKQLIPVANKPVIQHAIENLRDTGIDEIGIVFGGKFPQAMQEFIGDGSEFEVDITYILQGAPLGLAHAVGCARDFVDSDPFVVYFGDTIIEQETIENQVQQFDRDDDILGLSLQEVDDPSRYGIAEFDDGGEISRVLEKPDDPPSNLAYIGSIVFDPEVFEYIRDLEPSWRGELELTDVICNIVADDSSVSWQVQEGIWKDVGTPTDVVETNRILLEEIEKDLKGSISADATVSGTVSLGAGSVVEEGATVRGPVSIGENSTIGNGAEIGPHVGIGADCVIRGGTIRNSVIMDEVRIDSSENIVDSLIGSETTISESANKTKYILGEDSTVRGD